MGCPWTAMIDHLVRGAVTCHYRWRVEKSGRNVNLVRSPTGDDPPPNLWVPPERVQGIPKGILNELLFVAPTFTTSKTSPTHPVKPSRPPLTEQSGQIIRPLANNSMTWTTQWIIEHPMSLHEHSTMTERRIKILPPPVRKRNSSGPGSFQPKKVVGYASRLKRPSREFNILHFIMKFELSVVRFCSRSTSNSDWF